jgi:hypothetical protein
MNLRLRGLALLTLLILAPTASRGANILAEVPSDALGFVLIHNLSSADTKIAQLGTLLQRNIPRPLAFLKEFAGIAEGLNADGDCLLAMFPGSGGNDESLQFCVWLPVTDYDRFLSSLGATSIDGVAAATIAGEDLLVAHRGDWALLMNPDQRERIAEVASASPSTPQMPRWNKWIEANNVTVVAFSPGVRSLVSLIDGRNADQEDAESAEANGPKVAPNQYQNRRVYGPARGINFTELFESAKSEFQKWLAAMPELAGAMHQANVIGCGLRVDASGNAVTSVRVGLYDEATKGLVNDAAAPAPLPLSLNEGGGFVMNGAGRVPTPILTTYAKAYARYAAADLKTEERTELDETSFQRLLDAIEPAAADVRSIVLLSQPGEAQEPVYTNNFVAIHVDSATEAIDHAKEVMRLWNSANRDAKGETKLVFDVEETKLGERTATQYSLDMMTLEGGIVVPEVRQAMEKLFGPGGKMRLWIVPTDDHTLLLAAATQDQVTAVLKVMDKKQPIDWKRGELGESNALLPAEADWRIFIDGHRYFDWQGREKAAVIGVPVIGGPLVRDFPASPPVGIAGGFREGELWLEVATLGPTLKSADIFLNRNRSRAAFQLRARAVAPAPVPAPAPKPK